MGAWRKYCRSPPKGTGIFIHGGYWMAAPIWPKGLQTSPLFGRSSNQEFLRGRVTRLSKLMISCFCDRRKARRFFCNFPKLRFLTVVAFAIFGNLFPSQPKGEGMKIYPPLMVLAGIITQLLIGYIAPVATHIERDMAIYRHCPDGAGLCHNFAGGAQFPQIRNHDYSRRSAINADGGRLVRLFAQSDLCRHGGAAYWLRACHRSNLGFDYCADIYFAGAANLDC